MSRLEAQNLDTIQAMQIRMNLQQLFTMDAKSARRFLDRWNAWVRVCDLGPMNDWPRRSWPRPRAFSVDRNRPFQRRPGSHQRQCPGRQAQGQGLPNQRNLKAIVYLIAGDVLANSPT